MKHQDRHFHVAIAIILFLFMAAIIPGFYGFASDTGCWKGWAEHIYKFGLKNAYSSDTNYPPLYQYVLWLFGKMAGSLEATGTYIGYLRIFTLAADYWALWLVYRWIDRRVDYIYVLLCCMLNVGYIYNTIIFGQVDAIFAALSFAAFFYLERGKHILSAVLIILAINMKLQAIIFIPLWGLLLISSLHRNHRWKDVAFIIPAIVLTEALLLLPFYFGEGGLLPVWKAVAGLANTSPYTSMNAFNMWFWIVGNEAVRDDIRSLFGMTYYQIGLLSFCLASLIAMWPVLKHTINTLSRRDTAPLSRETIWLTAALVTVSFFFFSTGMHERYSHAAFIFITAYSFYRRTFGLYALFTLAYLLNLDKVLHGLKIASYHTLIFDPNFIAALFAVCFIWAVFLLYRQVRRDQAQELAFMPSEV